MLVDWISLLVSGSLMKVSVLVSRSKVQQCKGPSSYCTTSHYDSQLGGISANGAGIERAL